jgi:hypothetical protein
LGARRREAFRALVATLQDSPDGRFGAVAPDRAVRRLARWYGAQPPAGRTHADAVLDRLADRGVPAYADLASDGAAGADPAWSATLAAAIALAATAAEPPADPDERAAPFRLAAT